MKRFAMLAMALAIIASVAQPAAAQGDFDSANNVVPGCREFLLQTFKEPLTSGFCLGMVTAYLSMAPGMYQYCIPAGVTPVQGMRVALAFIDRNTARTHERFAVLVIAAFHEAWPCHT